MPIAAEAERPFLMLAKLLLAREAIEDSLASETFVAVVATVEKEGAFARKCTSSNCGVIPARR
jgi:hypothetical protein